jgi:hypothetical protein
MVTKKKTPEEQQPEQEIVYKPMAAPEPTPLERLAALELRMAAMEKVVSQHNRYHFGAST